MSNTQRPRARELKIQEIYCLPCIVEAKRIDMKNTELRANDENAEIQEVPIVGIAVTWEVAITAQGMPLGPYPVCSFHVQVPSNSTLLTG